MSYLRRESAHLIYRRVEAAEAYLNTVLSARTASRGLSEAEIELVAARLESCEDFVTLSDVEWQRVCAILLPEKNNKAFRDYSAQTLSLWGKLCETVCPEEYATKPFGQPTNALPGTWEKVAVMELRKTLGQPLDNPHDRTVRDEEGVLAEQGSNGNLDARTSRGEATKRLLVAMRGEEKVVSGKDVEVDDPDWWRLRIPTGRSAPAVVEMKAEEVAAPPKRRGRKPKAKDETGWLPFFDLEATT